MFDRLVVDGEDADALGEIDTSCRASVASIPVLYRGVDPPPPSPPTLSRLLPQDTPHNVMYSRGRPPPTLRVCCSLCSPPQITISPRMCHESGGPVALARPQRIAC